MTDYILWARGLRGPSVRVLYGTPNLDEYDRTNRLALPVPIKPEHAGLPLDELARLYPAPVSPDEPPPSAPAAQALSAA